MLRELVDDLTVKTSLMLCLFHETQSRGQPDLQRPSHEAQASCLEDFREE